MKCSIHDFEWDISDPIGCPICHGRALQHADAMQYLKATYAELEQECKEFGETEDSRALLYGFRIAMGFLKSNGSDMYDKEKK